MLRRQDPLRWSKSLNDLRIQKNVNFWYNAYDTPVKVSLTDFLHFKKTQQIFNFRFYNLNKQLYTIK